MEPQQFPSNLSLADYLNPRIEHFCSAKGQSAAQEVAEAIGSSVSSAYKKLRGEVTFSAPELLQLARHFGISLDAFVGNPDLSVQFLVPGLKMENRSALQFLPNIYGLLSGLGSGLHLKYATHEIPLFYYLYFPELAAFKLYVWQKTVWLNDDQAELVTIEALLKDRTFHHYRKKLLQGFFSTPSDEFYPENMLDHTLSQIAFLRDTGDIEVDLARLLFGQINELTDLMEKWAVAAVKTYEEHNTVYEAPVNIYHNEIMYTNNLILAKSNSKTLVTCTLNNPNIIFSEDARVTEHIGAWFGKLKKNAQAISGSGERQRRAYFNNLRRRIGLYQ